MPMAMMHAETRNTSPYAFTSALRMMSARAVMAPPACHNCRHAGRQDDGCTLATDCWHPHSRFPPAEGEVMSTRFHPMAEMLADENLAAEIGQNARLVVQENLGSIERTVDMIIEKLDSKEIYVVPGK